jgi:hypothetical protein
MGAIGAFHLAALLHEEAIARAAVAELGKENLLGAMVGSADEIGWAFKRDLKLLNLAEIAREAAARFAGGGEHDIHQRGSGHAALSAIVIAQLPGNPVTPVFANDPSPVVTGCPPSRA